jgi:hypothetical protein
MNRERALILIVLILLTACTPLSMAQSTNTAPPMQTAKATVFITPSPKPTPMPVTVFSDSLGLNADFSAQLKQEGINSAISGEKGNWTISQVISGWNSDGTPIIEQNTKIVSFSDSDVHNAGYANGILTGVDSQGKTVFWSEEEKAFVRPLGISENIESPNFYPWDKQYLAIESALLNPALNASFSDEEVKNYKGITIASQFDKNTQTSHSFLVPLDNQSIRWALDENGKPVWFTTTAPDGTVYESILTQLLNPVDPSHPKANETEFALASAGEWFNGTSRTDFEKTQINSSTNPSFWQDGLPRIELAENGGWFANDQWGSLGHRPSLDSLLGQPGNNLNGIKLGDYGFNIQNVLGSLNDSNEQYVFMATHNNLIYFQKLLFVLSFATK